MKKIPWKSLLRTTSLLGVIAVVASCYGEQETENVAEQASAIVGTGIVHGNLVTSFTNSTAVASEVGVPLTSVYIKNGAYVSATVTSDLSGFFNVGKIPAGSGNTVCWVSASLGSGCGASFTVNTKGITYAPHANITLQPTWVYGTISRAGGSRVHLVNGTFGTDVRISVKLTNSLNQTVAGPVIANDVDQYVIGGGSLSPGTYNVVATSGTTTTTTTVVMPATYVPTSLIANMTIANRNPVITSVYAYQGGKVVQRGLPGSSIDVKVLATDPDGDALAYFWKSTNGASNLCTVNAATSIATCTLPATTSFADISVRVSDGKNGYAFGRVAGLKSGPATASFSGTVLGGPTWVGLNNASIALSNGTATTTGASNANGTFSVTANESDRYVLTVKSPGYLTYSQVLLHGLSGTTIRLAPMTGQVFDPAVGVTLSSGAHSTTPATLTIPPNALVNATTLAAPPAGTMLTGYYAEMSFQQNPGAMPGDGAGTDANGAYLGNLESFGASEVNIFDSSNNRYQLVTTQTALWTQQLNPLQSPTAPVTAPIWYYDEVNGTWVKHLTVVATLANGKYTASLPHFSAINVDIAKANADCMEVDVDKAALPGSIDVRVSAPLELGGPPIVQDRTLGSDEENAITRVPSGMQVTVSVLDADHQVIPGTTTVVTAGQAGLDPATNLPYVPFLPTPLTLPYMVDKANPASATNKCHTLVKLTLVKPAEPNGEGGFLHHNNDSNDLSIAAKYYAIIDPVPSTRDTLAKWKAQNNFTTDALDTAHAYYFNRQDLGVGRAMHMKKTDNNHIAFYVTNYKTKEDAYNASTGALPAPTPVTTVAMEYTPPAGNPAGAPFVKFFIFDGIAGEPRLGAVDLDGNGLKTAPEVCITCHGGSRHGGDPSGYNTDLSDPLHWTGDTLSMFLPFDVASFDYAADGPLDPQGPLLGQQEAFYQMNQVVAAAIPASVSNGAILELVNTWYPGGTHVANTSAVPPGWDSTKPAVAPDPAVTLAQQQLYTNVEAKSCRSCHVTRDSVLDFRKWADFKAYGSLINGVACGSKIMPQSKVTWNIFWGSTQPVSQPAQLAQVLGPATNPTFAVCQ